MTVEYRLTLRTRLETPFHTGTGEEDVLTDAPLARGADGRIRLLGTSLAGAVRSTIERLVAQPCAIADESERRPVAACGCPTCALLGDVNPAAEHATSSKAIVHDALIDGAVTTVRDSVGIDRAHGSAAYGRKFDREVALPDAALTLETIVRDPTDGELGLLAAALRLVGTGRVPIGAMGAQGYGRLATDGAVTIRYRDLARSDHLLAALTSHDLQDEAWPGQVTSDPGAALALPDEDRVDVVLRVSDDSLLLISEPRSSTATGIAHVTRGADGSRRWLDGPELRGAFRAGAERILRTLSSAAACDPFSLSSCSRAPNRPPCLACRAFGNEARAGALLVSVTSIPGRGHLVDLDSVAIDRFTGGARNGLKFDSRLVGGAAFSVSFVNRAPEDDRRWIGALVDLTLDDVHSGYVRLGSSDGPGFLELAELRGIDRKVAIDALREAVEYHELAIEDVETA